MLEVELELRNFLDGANTAIKQREQNRCSHGWDPSWRRWSASANTPQKFGPIKRIQKKKAMDHELRFSTNSSVRSNFVPGLLGLQLTKVLLDKDVEWR